LTFPVLGTLILLMKIKKCSKCNQSKPLEAFSKDKANPDGLRYYCRDCMSVAWKAAYAKDSEKWRARSKKWVKDNPIMARRVQKHADLMARYGISLETYEKMCADQQGKCAICGEIPTDALNVDHDHEKEGKPEAVRGLLCTCCNRAFGLMKESPEIFEAAAAYARKHKPS